MYKLKFTKQALKDAQNIKAARLSDKLQKILDDIEVDPYSTNNNYEALKYNLSGFHSKRINYKHRLVYEVKEKQKEIVIHRMWSHYDKL